MFEIIGVFVIGAVAGGLLGGAIGYDRGWRNGVTWAQARIFGH
jgi:uncharacterized membrane protein YhiD involved in acid resistance